MVVFLTINLFREQKTPINKGYFLMLIGVFNFIAYVPQPAPQLLQLLPPPPPPPEEPPSDEV